VAKQKIIKKFETLAPELLKLVQETYPDGYDEKLISFLSPKGELEFALPLETEEISYLIKIPKNHLPAPEEEEEEETPSENLDDFDGLEAAEDIADED